MNSLEPATGHVTSGRTVEGEADGGVVAREDEASRVHQVGPHRKLDLDAIDHFANQGLIDPERVGLIGRLAAVALTEDQVIIGATEYGGEIKKSIFSAMNYLLPFKNVMPMHCSANDGDGGAAIFFG